MYHKIIFFVYRMYLRYPVGYQVSTLVIMGSMSIVLYQQWVLGVIALVRGYMFHVATRIHTLRVFRTILMTVFWLLTMVASFLIIQSPPKWLQPVPAWLLLVTYFSVEPILANWPAVRMTAPRLAVRLENWFLLDTLPYLAITQC